MIACMSYRSDKKIGNRLKKKSIRSSFLGFEGKYPYDAEDIKTHYALRVFFHF